MSIATMCKITNAVRLFFRSAAVRTPLAATGIACRRSVNGQDTSDRRLVAAEIGRKYQLSDDVLSDVSRRMSRAMDLGTRCPSAATIKCWDTRVAYPTAADGVVKPKAISQYLSLELSGGEHALTKFTEVTDTNDVLVWSQTYPIPTRARLGTGRCLFDRVSACLADFTSRLGVRTAGVPLVFTLGFPVRQTASDATVLYRMTREYGCADLVGRDVVAGLRKSLSRVRVRTGPVFVLNDASAALMDSAADDPTTRVSIVVDTGCNCCYVDRAVDVGGYVEPSSPAGKTIVNTEWGAFGDDGVLDFLRTKHDVSLDERSRQPGKQIFEKMTSGMYVAELVRRMVLEMTERKALFGGHVTSKMNTEYALRAEHLSVVESDAQQRYRGGREVLADVFGVADPTDFDCELFRYACTCAARRSAHLVAAGLSSVLRRLKSNATATVPHATVATGGYVLRSHPKYASLVENKTRSLTADDDVKFTFRTIDQNRNGLLVSGVLAKMMVEKPPT